MLHKCHPSPDGSGQAGGESLNVSLKLNRGFFNSPPSEPSESSPEKIGRVPAVGGGDGFSFYYFSNNVK